jgi:hypothetical protein
MASCASNALDEAVHFPLVQVNAKDVTDFVRFFGGYSSIMRHSHDPASAVEAGVSNSCRKKLSVLR